MIEGNKCEKCGQLGIPKLQPGSRALSVRCQHCGEEFPITSEPPRPDLDAKK